MVELKKWTPFRFLRENRRSPERPARNASMPLTLASMRDEMERMFDRFWTNPMAAMESQDRWFGDFSPAQFEPQLDVTDDANFVRVSLEVPGVEMKDLDIEVQDGVMTITGEKKQEATRDDEGCYHTERSYGWFRRSLPLPVEVETAKAEAKFDKGVLTIRLPKSERAKQQATKIPIKS